MLFRKRKPKVWVLRYENPTYLRENGKPHFREVTVTAPTAAEARLIADRRCGEAYGNAALEREQRIRNGVEGETEDGKKFWVIPPVTGYIDPAAQKLREIPGAHHDGYVLVSVQERKP